MADFPNLVSTFTLGDISLSNRAVMAPMTRSRAIGNVPNDLMAQYYAQRASAGLIITEGTSPSPNGVGYPRIPGAYSDAQIAGCQKVQSISDKLCLSPKTVNTYRYRIFEKLSITSDVELALLAVRHGMIDAGS